MAAPYFSPFTLGVHIHTALLMVAFSLAVALRNPFFAIYLHSCSFLYIFFLPIHLQFKYDFFVTIKQFLSQGLGCVLPIIISTLESKGWGKCMLYNNVNCTNLVTG